MNKIIKVIRLGTPQDIKKSIKRIVDQLEKNNYAFTSDVKAVRLFSRFIKTEREDDRIVVSWTNGKNIKNVIAIKPDLMLIRTDDFSFKLKIK